jgi:hypothetical protein
MINLYSFKPKPWFYSKAKFSGSRSNSNKALYMGIELEIEMPRDAAGDVVRFLYESSGTLKEKQRYYYLKHDGSLSNGCEIVSHPMSLWYHRGFTWDMIFDQLRRHGCSSDNSTCGLHVHVNRSFMQDKAERTGVSNCKLDLFVNAHKHNMVKLARRQSTFARFKNVWEMVSYGELGTNRYRYQALNFQNKKTVEFRIFKGTLDHPTFLASLELVDACCHFVKSTTSSWPAMFDNDSIQAWADYIWVEFLGYIRSFQRKYVILAEYLKERGAE